MRGKPPLVMMIMTTRLVMRRARVVEAGAEGEEGEDSEVAATSGVEEEDSGVDSGVDSAEGSVEVEVEAKVEEVMEELQEVASEAAEKVAEEVEASEEVRAGVVEKEEAGEVIAEPPRARARPNVFSMTCRQRTTKSHLHHISTKKIVTPPVLVAGHQYHHQSPCVWAKFWTDLLVHNFQPPPRHQNSKLAPISRVCLTSKILNRYLSPTRHFQGFSIKFNIDTGLKKEIPCHIGQPRPPRKMIPEVKFHHLRLEHAFQ